MLIDDRSTEIVLAFLRDVWSEGNVDASDQYLAASYRIHHDPGAPWAGQTLDVDGFKARVTASRAPFPDQRFEVLDVFGDGCAVVVLWRWTATHRGNLPGFPASGRPITTSGMTVYYVDAGRITGHWQVADRLGVVQQLQRAAAAGSERPAA